MFSRYPAGCAADSDRYPVSQGIADSDHTLRKMAIDGRQRAVLCFDKNPDQGVVTNLNNTPGDSRINRVPVRTQVYAVMQAIYTSYWMYPFAETGSHLEAFQG